MSFVTKIYHPMIDKNNGEFCNEAIAENWKTSYGIVYVVNTIHGMLQVRVHVL